MQLSTRLDSVGLIRPGLVGELIGRNPDMWQMDLFDAGRFAWFAHERNIMHFDKNRIGQLWHLCLLKADLITSSRKLKLAGLIDAGKNRQGLYLYADGRELRRRKKGWADSAKNLKSVPSWIELYFHPFRYYVLYHINRILTLHIHPMQLLNAVDRYPEALQSRQPSVY